MPSELIVLIIFSAIYFSNSFKLSDELEVKSVAGDSILVGYLSPKNNDYGGHF